MNKSNYTHFVPILALSGCLSTNYEVEDHDLTRCAQQVQMLENTCESATVVGKNNDQEYLKAVEDARECFGERVVILCSKIGLSGNSLYIGNYPQNGRP